jgi:DNA-directed RNA polymerase subunit RPC12/RpoP
MPHNFSIEILHHFNCSSCMKWWSIGDYIKMDNIICPHCGHKDKILEMNEKD